MTDTAERLVGRDTESALLARLLDEACAGSSRFVVLTGEPGIGKTYLLGELIRRAEARGCLVLEGRASELERELPFGLIVDAFDTYLESLDAHAFDRLAADERDELASVFPSLRSLASRSSDPSTVQERFRAHRAVRALLERLAARGPLVLALDDVHWSDGASAELIAHLLRRPPEAAVLLAATFRSGRAGAALAASIEAAAARGSRVAQVGLGPLPRDDAAALIDAAPAELDRLYRESGGNPFYLLALARSRGSGAAGAETAAALEPAGVPAAVIAAIATELDDLEAPVREFARAAAVAGDPFELDIAVAAADMAEPAALGALDELIARDLLRPDAVPRRFAFRHPLVRSAVYASAAPGARLLAHERCAGALARRGAPATARAHHVEQSARHGDTDAVAVLREAGQASAARAPSSAARYFDAALRILPAGTPAEERAGLLMALAGSKVATGRLEDGRAALLESLALAAGGPPLQRVGIISACAAVEQLLGRRAEANTRLTAALAELPERASPAGAALMIDLAVDGLYRKAYEEMRDWAQRALEAARPLGDPALTAAAAGILSFAETCTGPVRDAEAHRAEAAALIDAMTDEQLAVRIDAVAHLGGAEFYLDRFDEAMAHSQRGLAVARATGQGHFFPMLTQAVGNILFVTGRLTEATETLESALESARLADNGLGVAWTLVNCAYTAVEAGEIDDALRAAEEAYRLTGASDHVIGVWAGAILGCALLEAGQPARAVEVLVASGGGDDGSLVPGAWRATWLEWLTRCRLALGQPAEAERAAALADARARAFGLQLSSAAAARAEAEVALDRGDAATAAERALAAAAMAGDAGARVAAGVARTLAGRALAQAGERERATAELTRAAAELDACGSRRYRDRAERELRALGHAVHRRTRRGKADGGGVASLSGRELEVARLVVDRRTNLEIAAELFLSIKTVETHMRNLFRKLDASSRVEVARAIERAEREAAGDASGR